MDGVGTGSSRSYGSAARILKEGTRQYLNGRWNKHKKRFIAGFGLVYPNKTSLIHHLKIIYPERTLSSYMHKLVHPSTSTSAISPYFVTSPIAQIQLQSRQIPDSR
jgi:hypothetical protein